MNREDLISIIVPVYNTEQYLREALDTIRAQTYPLFEVILVDDGSSDSSPSIIDEYCGNDDRFKAIHKENGGPSAARNAGLDIAKGRYVVFWDSDDRPSEDALEKMHETISQKKADLVVGAAREFDIFKKNVPKGALFLSRKEKIDRYDRNFMYSLSVWNKMFDLSIINDNKLRFSSTKYIEDGDFLWRYISASKTIAGCDSIVYNLRIRPFWEEPSLTQIGSAEMFRDLNSSFMMMKQTVEQMYESEKKAMLDSKASDESIAELTEKKDILLDAMQYRYASFNLVDTFYRIIWKNKTDFSDELNKSLRPAVETLSEERKAWMVAAGPDIDFLKDLPSRAELAAKPKLSVIISEKTGSEAAYMLANLYSQRFPSFCVCISDKLEEYVEDTYKNKENLRFYRGSLSNKELLKQADPSEYFVIADKPVYWDSDTFRDMVSILDSNENCVICEAKDKGDPSSFSNRMIRTSCVKDPMLLPMLSNKIIRRAYRSRIKKSKKFVYSGSIEGLK